MALGGRPAEEDDVAPARVGREAQVTLAVGERPPLDVAALEVALGEERRLEVRVRRDREQ